VREHGRRDGLHVVGQREVASLGERARERARELTPARMVDAYLALYRSLDVPVAAR